MRHLIRIRSIENDLSIEGDAPLRTCDSDPREAAGEARRDEHGEIFYTDFFFFYVRLNVDIGAFIS